jgi:hypothetical protein
MALSVAWNAKDFKSKVSLSFFFHRHLVKEIASKLP